LIGFGALVALATFSGFTIFLGLPLALMRGVGSRSKGFLNALAIGILVFLITDVFNHAWTSASGAAAIAFLGTGTVADALVDLLAMFGGIALGLLSLVFYESKYMSKVSSADGDSPQRVENSGSTSAVSIRLKAHALEESGAYRLAMMIAIGIGAHNFSEGLAIGQSYVAGSIGLALILIIGFGAHNATEGFGIASPLTRLAKRPSVKFLATTGLVGGGPTFLGTIVGSLWTSTFVYILFLSIAGGALVYVSLLMYNSGRRHTTNGVLMTGIFAGLCAGFLTDLLVTLGGA
jgi:ZIP family zinc transporter